jgi:hypothetical protein
VLRICIFKLLFKMYLSRSQPVALVVLCIYNIYAAISLPPLNGSFSVGTKRIEVTDYSRFDPYIPTPQYRSPILQLWYPIATNKSLSTAPWLPDNTSYYMNLDLGFAPGTAESIQTQTFVNGTAIFPLATNNTVPVLVFSPGFGALSAGYSTILSSLASYGWTVVAIDHPYDSNFMQRPGGEVVFQPPPPRDNLSEYIQFASKVRADDVLWVGGQLNPSNISRLVSLPPNHLDGKEVKLGIFGHSLGGNTANLAMEHDLSLYIAGASIDGPIHPPLNSTGFFGPLLYMAGVIDSCCHSYLVNVWPKIKGWKLAVEVAGTTHSSFSDLTAIVPQLVGGKPVEELPSIGDIEAEKMIEIVTQYLLSYWEWNLRGGDKGALLMGEVDEYPEVKWEDLDNNGKDSYNQWFLKKQL